MQTARERDREKEHILLAHRFLAYSLLSPICMDFIAQRWEIING
jgi:hypothetical protein